MDRLSDYDYILPESAIAQNPLEDRASSKLLWLHRDGRIEHRAFRDAVDILQKGDLLVLNDTRVSALRLFGKKPTGASIEVLLLRDLGNDAYEALAKPGNRLQPGARAEFPNDLSCTFEANLGDGRKRVRFSARGPVREAILLAGQVPLPPYIHAALRNPERYQTVYADQPGSAAAPTAGLHFTQEILRELKMKGVRIEAVTLDVGLDTFRPVKAEILSEHRMHGERCSVPDQTAEAVQGCKGRIVAVGTTAVRTLESFASGPRKLNAGSMNTSIFIRPGLRV